MADIKAIKGTNGTTYSIVDRYSDWGGRNLLKNVPTAYDSSLYNAYDIRLTEPLEDGVTYTLQLWNVDVSHSAKTEAQLGIFPYYCGGSVRFGGWTGTGYFTDGHADHLVMTFTPYISGNTITEGSNNGASPANALAHSSVTTAVDGGYQYIRLYNSVPNATGTRSMLIEKWKLEKGHKATDWSPCWADMFTYGSEQITMNI